jgi:hypothetical protein
VKASKRLIVLLFSVAAVVLVAAVVIIVFAFAFTLPKPGPAKPLHPSPMALSKQYMTAIASGDGKAARAIDHDSAGARTPGIDNTTFTTGPSLANATERIHGITYTLQDNFSNTGWVTAHYMLAGTHYKSDLEYTWKGKSWHLNNSIASLVSVNSQTSIVDQQPIPFTLGGVPAAALPAGAEARDGMNGLYYTSLAYPAVYPLVASIDPETLADPTTPTTTTLMVPPDPYKGGELDFILATPRN